MLNITDIKDKVTTICNGTKVVKMVLFGSYAKGTATINSDIDLFMISNGAITGLSFYDLKSKIEDAFNVEVDLIPDLDIIPDSLVEQQINEHGVIVYEQ